MQYYVGKKCLKIEIWFSFLKGNIDWKVLTAFSVLIWITLVITWCQSFIPLSEAPDSAGCGQGEGSGAALGQGWAPTAAVAILCLVRVWWGTWVPPAWRADRCWIPAQLLIVVVQPWFMGVLASRLLCWTSPSSPSQSLAPSCRYLHSRPKFRKNWLSPKLPVAADIFSKAPVKHSALKNYFCQNK